ncbi:acyltransferase domain-containing protein [Streptomyces sp. NBC_01808]|uniref:acyltransferase domain-containing protein n=1 Tax=Streptomyces sp. NBC_01808 TaxID=2975947 RepID=UPI002DDB07E7|nr:acyltransferase domain-containing protein [Streptomyces sp. NBC_01808]WSA42046.1 acyltransferase domain-containing protein [Streptomyces sp. NBC_01808]
MTDLNAAAVRDQLGLDGTYAPWTDALAAAHPAPPPAGVPRGAELTALLRAVGVPEREDAELTAALAEVTAAGSPYAWLLDRAVAALAAAMGSVGDDRGGPGSGPALPAALGAAGRWFHTAVFLAAVPEVRAYHARRDVPDDVSRATLADLGSKVGVHRRLHGEGGMGNQRWMTLPYGGILYRLGRLQFNLDHDPEAGRGLEVHIPEGGPLDPRACEESYARAAEFFPRRFGAFLYGATEGAAGGGELRLNCASWLLDPRLGQYLPADSNIIRFQRRFTLDPHEPARVPEPDEHGLAVPDRGIVEFVFRRVVRTPADVAALPARTTLERAVVAHIADGGHWGSPRGSFMLPVPG